VFGDVLWWESKREHGIDMGVIMGVMINKHASKSRHSAGSRLLIKIMLLGILAAGSVGYLQKAGFC
jgi:hypothetical protein